MRVHDFGVGSRCGRLRLTGAVPTLQPVQLDLFVAVRAHLDQVVRRRAAGAPEVQRHTLVDARRPPLEPNSQARLPPPIGQHVHPVDAPAITADQQRVEIVAVVRTPGHVARIRFSGAAHSTPNARRLSSRVPAVVGRLRHRLVGERVTRTGVVRLQ